METENDPSEETKERWLNDPDNWIWGMFYYNPKDKRLYFPKKIKELGWQMNYAHPEAKIILSLMLTVLITVFILYFKK